jgi:hypothetical protein
MAQFRVRESWFWDHQHVGERCLATGQEIKNPNSHHPRCSLVKLEGDCGWMLELSATAAIEGD